MHITHIIIHCSAVRPHQTSSAAQIDRWHKQRGWWCIGYHYVVRRDGTIEKGRDERTPGAHTLGMNHCSIGICYEGGLDAEGKPADTRTPQQKESLLQLLRTLLQRYPRATIHGHREYARKACPCFDAKEEYKNLSPLSGL